jgi:hypothetical protein
MRKSLLVMIIYVLTTTKVLVGQTQSLSFSGPGQIPSGPTTFTVSVSLTFSGYNAFGLSYWVQVDNALAPFLSITNAQYFTFPDPNQPPNHAPFNLTSGADAGYMSELPDLGANFTNGSNMVGPGTYHITDLTFQLAAGAPGGSHTLRITTLVPRNSVVDDAEGFNEYALPAASFTFNVVPEPSTIALLVVAAILALVARHKGS